MANTSTVGYPSTIKYWKAPKTGRETIEENIYIKNLLESQPIIDWTTLHICAICGETWPCSTYLMSKG